jgi:RNA polymerase sigma factor (sigma-70 family)
MPLTINYQNYTDLQLTAACLRGERGAWEELVYRFSPLVYAIPLRKCQLPVQDAEDIVQSVFQTVFEKLGDLEDGSKLRAWMVSIAWRKSIDWIRARRDDEIPLDDMPPMEDEGDRPSEAVSTYERRRILGEALAELGDIHARAIIECRFYEGMSYREISDALGIPIGSIGPMMGRGLEKLRSILYRKGMNDLSF